MTTSASTENSTTSGDATRRRACVEHVTQVLDVSERRACRALGQHRSTQRKAPRGRDDEEQLTADIIALAREYGRYGYRKITALLRAAGWVVNAKRVERIWRREGLKVPAKQPKKGRLWLNDGSCVRLRPERLNHVWAYDFVEARTHDGRKFRMLSVVDEFTHECLAIRMARKLKATDVIDVLSDLFMPRGASPATFAPITARSSWPRPCRTGSGPWAPRPPTSPQAAPGRTAKSSRSTLASETSCSTARSSTA